MMKDMAAHRHVDFSLRDRVLKHIHNELDQGIHASVDEAVDCASSTFQVSRATVRRWWAQQTPPAPASAPGSRDIMRKMRDALPEEQVREEILTDPLVVLAWIQYEESEMRATKAFFESISYFADRPQRPHPSAGEED